MRQMTNGAPLWFRLLNRAGALARGVGVPTVSLQPEALVQRARRTAKLEDFGDAEDHAGLVRLCRSLEEDAQLSLGGRIVMRENITNALVNRLRLVEATKRSPETFETPLVAPLLVVGLPRSGTTLLHRLLSLAEGARPLLLWEVLEPMAGPGPDQRRDQVQKRVRMLKRLAPAYDAKHHLDADEPDECALLLDSSFTSAVWCMMAPVFGYIDWVKERDPTPSYRMYTQFLQHFQAQTPDRRLTLKAPLHTAYLDSLFANIPNLMVVQTHRDPVQVIPSLVSLFETMYGIISKVEREVGASFVADVIEMLIDRNMDARDRISADRLIDISYDDLTADPLGTTHKIYAHFGLDWTDAHERRIREWTTERPRHRLGVHTYDLNGSGLTQEGLAQRFARYRARFNGHAAPKPTVVVGTATLPSEPTT